MKLYKKLFALAFAALALTACDEMVQPKVDG